MFQLKSVSEMRNEELMSFKLKWSFHIIRIKLKYDSHSYFSGQKKSRLSHHLDSRDHLYSFKLLDVKHESNQPRYDSTDRVINISQWGETQAICARWGEECGQFITRRAEVQGVMCYVLQLGVCLVFLLCLISPAEQHQPPPTPSTRRGSHVVTPGTWEMSPTHETWGEGSTP